MGVLLGQAGRVCYRAGCPASLCPCFSSSCAASDKAFLSVVVTSNTPQAGVSRLGTSF